MDPYTVAEMIGWMGPYVCSWAQPEARQFVGYIKYEYIQDPLIIWHDGTGFVLDLPDDEELPSDLRRTSWRPGSS